MSVNDLAREVEQSARGFGLCAAEGVAAGMAVGSGFHVTAAGLHALRGGGVDPRAVAKHALSAAMKLGLVVGTYRGLKFCMDGASPTTRKLNAAGAGALAMTSALLTNPAMARGVMEQQAAIAGRSLGVPGAVFSFMLMGAGFFGVGDSIISAARGWR